MDFRLDMPEALEAMEHQTLRMAEVIRKFLEHPDLDNNTLEEVPDYLTETSKLLGMMATELHRRREIGEWKPLED